MDGFDRSRFVLSATAGLDLATWRSGWPKLPPTDRTPPVKPRDQPSRASTCEVSGWSVAARGAHTPQAAMLRRLAAALGVQVHRIAAADAPTPSCAPNSA